MNRDGWIGLGALAAITVFVVVLVVLARDGRDIDAAAPGAFSDTLPMLEVEPVEDTPIETVEIVTRRAPDGQPGGAVSASDLIARFEHEDADAGWARPAEGSMRGFLVSVLGDGAQVMELECRSSLCRVRIEFPDPTRRARGMERLMEAIHTPGSPVRHAAIERLGTIRATLLLEPAG